MLEVSVQAQPKARISDADFPWQADFHHSKENGTIFQHTYYTKLCKYDIINNPSTSINIVPPPVDISISQQF